MGAAPVATSLDDAFGEADDLKDLDGLSADQIRQRGVSSKMIVVS